jgi:hypothetical protein
MKRTLSMLIVSALVGGFLGCDGSESKPTEEQKAPDYGQKTGDQMKTMIGVPTSKGMAPAKPAGK